MVKNSKSTPRLGVAIDNKALTPESPAINKEVEGAVAHYKKMETKLDTLLGPLQKPPHGHERDECEEAGSKCWCRLIVYDLAEDVREIRRLT